MYFFSNLEVCLKYTFNIDLFILKLQEVYLKYTSFKKKGKKYKWSIIENKQSTFIINKVPFYFILFLYFIYTFFSKFT